MAFLLMVQVNAERQNEFSKDSRESIAPAAQRPRMASKKDGILQTSRSLDRNNADTGTASSVLVKKQVATESNSQEAKWSPNSAGEHPRRRSELSKSSRSSVEPSALSQSGIQGKESRSSIIAAARRSTDSVPQSTKPQGNSATSNQQQDPRVLPSIVQRDSSLPTGASERSTRTGARIAGAMAAERKPHDAAQPAAP
eukprot:CAMPEP_0172184908 /NCGR_PEP_ID=MMETSP1050-20130122/19852_1 /TAXON_ID=233186 /ORGANISM="Cryptomonas curvata, Strain CCAP979/52" /LENGTH=197 /DNA_ID=CAMNT_0012858789 /DNA_START=134 /DNA_END=723 /DNA_ORIENTATION=+